MIPARRSRYDARMRIVPVVNQKGGVGKSTVVMNLAAVAAERQRVLVVDADHLQQTATSWAAAGEAAGRELPFDFDAVDDPALIGRLRGLRDYDLVLIDTPGSLAESERPRIAAALDVADLVIMPIEPAYNSIKPLVTTVQSLVAPRGTPYRVLLSRVQRDDAGRKRRDETAALLDEMGLPRFETAVRQYVVHLDAPASGDVVTTYPVTRATLGAQQDFRELALELDGLAVGRS